MVINSLYKRYFLVLLVLTIFVYASYQSLNLTGFSMYSNISQGTYLNTTYNSTGYYIQLVQGEKQGLYISNIIDAENEVRWNNISWVSEAFPYCSGNTMQCSLINNTSNCENQIGCNWNLSSCEGMSDSCDSFGDNSTCMGQEGCEWSLGSCSGYGQCTELSESQCGDVSGCHWIMRAHFCVGSPDCGDIDKEDTCSGADCHWNSGICDGTASSCTYEDQNSCENQSGCEWSRENCYGQSIQCNELLEGNCTTQTGCEWDVAELIFSVRSCNTVGCDDEAFVGNYSYSTNLSIPNNRYFQYKTGFYTGNTNYSPKLYNVSIGFELVDTEPPAIESEQITQGLTSGEMGVISANVTDESDVDVWAGVKKGQDITNYSMSGEHSTYSVEFEAGETGTWYYRIYAEDEYSNVNSTVWNEFTVSKPFVVISERYPSYALPLSTMTVKSSLYANELLKGAVVRLNTVLGFPFGSYPQMQEKGNFSVGANRSVKWIVSAPAAEGVYVFNITWSDKYGNEWVTEEKEVRITYDTANLTGKIETLGARFSVAQSDINNMQDSISGINNTLNNISGELISNTESISAIQSSIAGLEVYVDGLESTVGIINETVNVNAQNISALASNQGNINNQVSVIDTQLSSVQASINVLDERVNETEVNVSSLRDEFTIINSMTNSLNTYVNTLNTTVSSLSTRVDSLEDLFEVFQTEFSTMGSDVTGLQNSVSRMNNTMNSMNESIVSNAGAISTIQSDIIGLESYVNSVQNMIVTINTTVNVNAQNISVLASNQNNIIGQINAVSSQLDDIDGNISYLYNETGNNQVDVFSAKNTIASMNTQINDIDGDIFDLIETVEAIFNKVSVYIDSFVEVEAGEIYTAEIWTRKLHSNEFVNPDSIEVYLYDPEETLVESSSGLDKLSTGKYLYEYSMPTVPTGHWAMMVNISEDDVYYSKKKYFRVTSGPFDLKNIRVVDNKGPVLNISAVIENKGKSITDIIIDWKLVGREDGKMLDSGQETLGVEDMVMYNILPRTNYTGTVNISFIGTWPSANKAKASETFDVVRDFKESNVSASNNSNNDIITSSLIEMKRKLRSLKVSLSGENYQKLKDIEEKVKKSEQSLDKNQLEKANELLAEASESLSTLESKMVKEKDNKKDILGIVASILGGVLVVLLVVWFKKC